MITGFAEYSLNADHSINIMLSLRFLQCCFNGSYILHYYKRDVAATISSLKRKA